MKLSFRDLKQTRFSVDAEPSDTIKALKQKITEVRTEWDADSLKLIYSGKILQDDKTVESYKIEEKGYIVCMVQKPKQSSQTSTPSKTPTTPASAPKSSSAGAPQRDAPTASTATTVPLGAEPATPTPAARTQQPATSTTTAAAASAAAAAAAAATGGPLNDNSLLVGAASQNAIAEMEAMGFPRDMATRAMRAAFFNPDRAIEYLLNGIPESAERQQQQAESQPQQSQQPPHAPSVGAEASGPAAVPVAAGAAAGTDSQQQPVDEPINLFEAAASAAAQPRAPSRAGPGSGAATAPAAAGEGGSGGGLSGLPTIPSAAGQGAGGNLAFLRDNPHFQHLRSIVQQQPQMLEPILQSLGTGNPQLAQMIAAHQEEFLQLLSEDGGEGVEGLEGYDGVMPTAGQTTIAVTEEERDAIERLCNLGFSRDSVIQAYFACDKNEELAANFLFDQPDEDEP